MSDAIAWILLAALVLSPFALFWIVHMTRKRRAEGVDTAVGGLGCAEHDRQSGGGQRTDDVGGDAGSPDLSGFDATPTPEVGGGGGDSD